MCTLIGFLLPRHGVVKSTEGNPQSGRKHLSLSKYLRAWKNPPAGAFVEKSEFERRTKLLLADRSRLSIRRWLRCSAASKRACITVIARWLKTTMTILGQSSGSSRALGVCFDFTTCDSASSRYCGQARHGTRRSGHFWHG